MITHLFYSKTSKLLQVIWGDIFATFVCIYDFISDLILDLDKQMNEKLIRVKRKDEPIPEIAIEPQMCICNKCPGTYVLIY